MNCPICFRVARFMILQPAGDQVVDLLLTTAFLAGVDSVRRPEAHAGLFCERHERTISSWCELYPATTAEKAS